MRLSSFSGSNSHASASFGFYEHIARKEIADIKKKWLSCAVLLTSWLYSRWKRSSVSVFNCGKKKKKNLLFSCPIKKKTRPLLKDETTGRAAYCRQRRRNEYNNNIRVIINVTKTPSLHNTETKTTNINLLFFFERGNCYVKGSRDDKNLKS